MTPPEWEEADRATMEELRRTGVASPVEKEFIRADGTRVPVLLSAATFEGTRSRG